MVSTCLASEIAFPACGSTIFLCFSCLRAENLLVQPTMAFGKCDQGSDLCTPMWPLMPAATYVSTIFPCLAC